MVELLLNREEKYLVISGTRLTVPNDHWNRDEEDEKQS